MRDPSDPPVQLLIVVPAKAGTHNHKSSLSSTGQHRLCPKLRLRSMGPGFRRDDGYCKTSNTPRGPHHDVLDLDHERPPDASWLDCDGFCRWRNSWRDSFPTGVRGRSSTNS